MASLAAIADYFVAAAYSYLTAGIAAITDCFTLYHRWLV
jgi:hypothetical protein